jgi:hypothetical protein
MLVKFCCTSIYGHAYSLVFAILLARTIFVPDYQLAYDLAALRSLRS